MPNITTNDVYYRQQLSVYSFNVHVLHSNTVYIYSYDETVAKKGSDDVCSMLYHFICNHVKSDVTRSHLFCNGCTCQNKNWTVIHFLYYLVHVLHRFQSIVIGFPVRGHSYMECDSDMVHVNQKARVEFPDKWCQEFEQARQNPAPFNVVRMPKDGFLKITDGLKPYFRITRPTQTRPIRELRVAIDNPNVFLHRNNWNGEFSSTAVSRNSCRSPEECIATSIVFQAAYAGPLAISKPKYNDLQVLKKFCSAESQAYFDSLIVDDRVKDNLHEIEHENDE